MAASPIVVNTNSFCEDDLKTFLECSEKIENSVKRRRGHRVKKAIKTNEEVFEAITSYDDSMKKVSGEESFLSKSASIENLLKYFEEDVKVDSDQEMKKPESIDGPVEEPLILPSEIKRNGQLPSTGDDRKSTANDHSINNIKPSDLKAIRKQSSAPSGSYAYPKNTQLDPMRKFVKLSDLDLIDQKSIEPKSTNPGPRPNYRHLEPSDLNLTLKEWDERYFQIMQNTLTPKDINLTQEQWDERYFQLIRKDLKPVDQVHAKAQEDRYFQLICKDLKPVEQVPAKSLDKSFNLEEKPSKWEKALRPKKSVKSKVQKIAEMFNGMINQVMKNNDQPMGNYERFANELSPEPELKPVQTKIHNKAIPVHRHNAAPRTSQKPSLRPSPKPSPKPSPRMSKRPMKQTGCLVPEEVFSKLSVKDKALLFNKFMKEMSLKNPEQFSFDPEEFLSSIEQKENAEPAQGMVLTEKQQTVMKLAKELEAKIIFPKQTISQAAFGKPTKIPSKKGPAPKPPGHATIKQEDDTEHTIQATIKQEEDTEETIHLSTLTVVLKPSPIKAESKAIIPRKKISPTTVVICPTMKRSNSQIASSIPIEVYAPPRKIRRTRPERSNSKKLSQNSNLEKLFYNWIKERNGVSFSIHSQEKDSTQNENGANFEPEDNERTIETDTTLKNEEIEDEAAIPKIESQATTQNNPSESDSSLLPMPSSKGNTDESQTDQAKESPDGDFEFAKPVRPPRKKKVKRATLTWKKEACIVEKLPLSTTDSDSDFKQKLEQQQKPKKSSSSLTDPAKCKKLIFKDSPPESAQNSFEVDEAFLDFMNSPRKIRKAYTLTAMSSPSQKTDSILSNKSDAPAKPPRKCRPAPQLPHEIDESKFENEDQGFETASTGYSPARVGQKPPSSTTFSVSPPMYEKSPLFIKLNAELERRMSHGSNQTPSAYSTPVKNNMNSSSKKSTPVKNPSWHTIFSPVASSSLSRRRSLAESEGRRSSIVMDVIREEHQQQQQQVKHETLDDDVFHPSGTSPSNTDSQNRSSSFWITVNDLTLSMEIVENPKERLSLLSNIFNQKSAETKTVHFGIDDLKYSPKDAAVDEDISKNLPKIDGVSHYWFASGDLAVPFQGNSVTPERVKEIFTFIRDSSLKEGRKQLSFGVDDVEFSKIPEPVNPGPKFSIESSYSMLIGLNGRSSDVNKFNWPSSSRNTTSMKTSDFDPSEFDSDSFEVSEMGRLSFSPYGGNYFDMASMQSSGERSSVASYNSNCSPEMFTFEYENEPLDKMFETKKTTSKPSTPPMSSDTFVFGKIDKEIKMPKPLPSTESMTVEKMIESIRRQQDKLQNVETNMKTYTSPAGFTSSVLDKYHGRPYVRKLHNIVKSIQIIAKTGFENCSAQQLETFLYFLSLYAETCLSSCSNQMNVILEQLRKDKGSVV